MNTEKPRMGAVLLRRCISLLLCLSMIASFAPMILAADAGSTPEVPVSDEITLTEEQANALMSLLFGEQLQAVEGDGDSYSYRLSEEGQQRLLAQMLPEADTDPNPGETKPAETDPAETDPAETDPAETKPAETKPAETKPAETKPAETKPAETKPAETKPAETKPAETKPAETKPAETKPAETKPAETKPVEENPNALPEGYVDNSNEGLQVILNSISSQVSTYAVEDRNTKVDLVFVIDSTGSMGGEIQSVKNNVAQFARYLAEKGITLRLGLIDYRDIHEDGPETTVVHKKSFSPWFDITSFINELTTVSANGGGDAPESAVDALANLTEGPITWNSDAYKFAMLITDAGYKEGNQHGVASMSDMISRLQRADIQVSVITGSSYMTTYGDLAGLTGGVQASIYDNFGVLLQEYADTVIGSAQTRKNYTLQINEETTGLPVAGAQISWNGGSATTNASGVATVTTRSNPVQNFRVSCSGYTTYTAASFDLEKNGCVKLKIRVDESADAPEGVPVVRPSDFKNPGSVHDTFEGPSIKLFGKSFNIFSVDIGMDLPVFNSVSVEHDGEEKLYTVTIGHDWEGKDPHDDPYWKDDYKKYKSLVKTFSEKSSKDICNEFHTLRKNHKSKADIAFPVDMNVAGYVEISYATGKLQISEGGVVIGVSTKDMTVFEWPLPPAPYVYFKLDFAADAEGKFTIVKLDSSAKLAMSIGLEEISVTPALTGTLNLGVPKLASVGGGLKGSFEFTFTGLPPKKLAEILTIEGNVDLVVKIKLLGFEGGPELNLGKSTLYPRTRSAGTYSALSVGMDDFRPIPPVAAATYGLGGLSDTLTFEKAAYADSAPQLIPFGTGWMMVWVDTVPGRPEAHHMGLYWSVYTEADGWSSPQLVADDGTGDFAPSLVLGSDGNPVVAWQNAADTEAATLEERMAHVGIGAAVYDPAAKAFGPAVTVPTTAGLAPLAVQTVADSSGTTVYWLENTANDPSLGNGTVAIRKCDLAALTTTNVKTGIRNMNGFAAGVRGGADTYAYTAGTTLYYSGGSRTVGTDCRSLQFVDGSLYWSDSKGFRRMQNSTVVTEGPAVPADFTLVPTEGEQRILLTSYPSGDGYSVLAAVSNNNRDWSDFTEIKSMPTFFNGAVSACATGTGLLWAASRGNSLAVESYEPKAELAVDPEAYVSDLVSAPGALVPVLVELENNSLLDISGLKARLADGTLVDMTVQNAAGEEVALTTLPAGASVVAAIPYTLPADLSAAHEITVDIVSGSNVWGSAKTTVAGQADLAVEKVTALRNSDGTATVTAQVTNRGAVAAKAVSAALTVEKAETRSGISTQNLGTLAPGKAQTVTFQVPAAELAASGAYDYKRLTVTAATTSAEALLADNSADVLLAPVPAESIAFTEDKVMLEMGSTHTLSYRLEPAGAAASVSFMSNNTDVVTVSGEGVLTPLKPGTTTVSVITAETEKMAEITVTVKGAVETGVSGVTVSPESQSLRPGQTVTLTASVQPSDATNQKVTWDTDTPDLLRLAPDGRTVVVTALGEGVGHVTAITDDGSYTATATIEVSGSADNAFLDVYESAYYYDAVQWAVRNGITSGTDVRIFSPNAACTRAQAVAFLWRAAGSPAPSTDELPFLDVADGAYYRDAVLWAVEKNVTAGTSADHFSPLAKCTRGQIVSFLWRAKGCEAVTGSNPFTDVSADAYYADAVLWAVENGITSGVTPDTFAPNAVCTRGQIVSFLYRSR